MQQQYRTLFTVGISHDYYSDRRLPALQIAPTAATARLMQGHGLLFRQSPGGFVLSFDALHAGGLRERADVGASGLKLLFTLRSQDPYLLARTGRMDAFRPGRSVLWFANDPARPDGRLHPGALADAAADEAAPPPEAGLQALPFALVEMDLGRLKGMDYSIRFGARSTIWRYYLVSDHLLDLEAPAIHCRKADLLFEGPESVELPDRRMVRRFVSPEPMPLKERCSAECQLWEHFGSGKGRQKAVVPSLPGPSAQTLLRADGGASGGELYQYSDIFL